jgi:hypothetical protein
MNELVNLIVTKTGIPAATAEAVVNTIVDYLKKKLPAPVGAQIDALLKDQGAGKIARTAKHRADDVIQS